MHNYTKQIIDIGTKDPLYSRLNNYVDNFSIVHLFEPNPIFAEKLLAKYEADNFNVWQLAISDQSGKSKFNIAKLNAASSLLEPSEFIIESLNLKSYRAKNHIEVKTDTLDNMLNKGQILPIPTYLKIDAQGMEYKIIESSKRFITSYVHEIIVEADFLGRYTGGSKYSEVEKILQDLGFDFIEFIDKTYFRERPSELFFADALWINKNNSSFVLK